MKGFSEYLSEDKKKRECKSCELDEEIRHGIPYKNATKDNLDREINLIDDPALREFVTEYLDKCVPDYFWTTAGAKSAGHHPDQDLGEGGLVRHTKMVTTVAIELLQNDLFADVRKKKDEVIAALICHDTQKNGDDNKKYAQDHPLLAGKKIEEFYKTYEKDGGKLSQKIKDVVTYISNHMGPNYSWRKPYALTKEQIAAGVKPGKIMPEPKDAFDSFVHLCDYIGSRMFIGDLSKYDDEKWGSSIKSVRDNTADYDDHDTWSNSKELKDKYPNFKDYVAAVHPESKFVDACFDAKKDLKELRSRIKNLSPEDAEKELEAAEQKLQDAADAYDEFTKDSKLGKYYRNSRPRTAEEEREHSREYNARKSQREREEADEELQGRKRFEAMAKSNKFGR